VCLSNDLGLDSQRYPLNKVLIRSIEELAPTDANADELLIVRLWRTI
jgi:hypothetical protein